MKEYIEREALRKAMQFATDDPTCPLHIAATVDQYITEAPAADVVERKRGEWVLGHVEPGYFTPGGNRPWMCSECGRCESWMLDKPKSNFCSNCGADMREVDHEAD